MLDVAKKKKLEFPNVYALLFMLAIFAALLTWVVPAGSFKRITEAGVTKVVAGSFKFVDQKPQGIWEIYMAIVKGFQNQIKLILMIFFVGAAIRMLEASKAIDAAFTKLARSVKGKEQIAIFLVMAFMSIGGATGVFGNVTLVLIPIGIFLSQAMGFDKTLGFFMIFFGSFSGFNLGWANPGLIGLAQTIAQLPMFSGIEVRMFFHLINFILSYAFVIMYFNKLKKDPSNSLNYEQGMTSENYMGSPDMKNMTDVKITTRQILALLITCVSMAAVIFGALKYKWGPDQMSATFMIAATAIGIVSGFGINGTAKEFIRGCAAMVTAAFIVGFANGIMVLLESGLILDTIVYYLSIPINNFGPVIGANVMLGVNILISLLISSGSGQATTVMPIMVPLADLTGITRQVAVQTFQFGDGFTNCIVPTVGTLMGGLGFAGITYGKYLKKVLPLILIQLGLSFVAITILQIIGWTGL